MVSEIRELNRSDIWINGGFFALRNEIFDYIQPGDELVRAPFQRLIEKQALLAYKYTGFLAMHGHFQRQATPGGAEPGRRAMEGLATNFAGNPEPNRD